VTAGNHSHVFLGVGHEANERKTWGVIALCSVMMVLEIGGGALFGSLALVADGLHMATHAVAILIAALAYSFARRHATDSRFTFGTGKVGDLAGFASAIVLAMIALLIGYEAVSRFFQPVVIHFAEAIPIAFLGLAVNIASAWLLSGGADHHHGPGHEHAHEQLAHAAAHSSAAGLRRFDCAYGEAALEIHESGMPPRFRLRFAPPAPRAEPPAVTIETIRPDGGRQLFRMKPCGSYLESSEEIPEPHEFTAVVRMGDTTSIHQHELEYSELDHAHCHVTSTAHRDHNLRSAFIHVLGDAAVSVLAILGLLAARYLHWLWMDPMMGLVGASVIAAWAYSLVRDTTRILVDMTPDAALEERIRQRIEAHGDRVTDLHLWRLGPGHLGAIVSIVTSSGRGPDFYRSRLSGFGHLSHLTVEVTTACTVR